MIIVRVKANQITPKLTNWRPQSTYFVNDAYDLGLKYGMFVTLEQGTVEGVAKATLTYAGNASATYTDIASTSKTLPAAKPLGILYESSPIDAYRRTDDLTNETRLFPKGKRQEKAYGLLPDAVLELSDTDNILGNDMYFRTVDYLITATADSFVNSTKTIVYPGNISTIRVGETLSNGTNEAIVLTKTYNSGTNKTTFVLSAGLGDSVLPLTAKCQLYKTLYVATDMTGDVPFTFVSNSYPVGWVESGLAARIQIKYI